MSNRRYVILTPLFEFGGSNTYLKLLDKYFENDDLYFVLEKPNQLRFYEQLHFDSRNRHVTILGGMHRTAKIQFPNIARSAKHFLMVLKSASRFIYLIMKLRTRNVIISAVVPEKYFYLIFIPFLKIRYVIHTIPEEPGYSFTSLLGNMFLGRTKNIVAVSAFAKTEICKLWDIKPSKSDWIKVIHNTILPGVPVSNFWSQHNKTIVTLGHVIEYKNPHLWLRVARKITSMFTNIEFKWVGDGPLLNELRSETENLTNINFIGSSMYPQEQFTNCFLYYQPSRMESHGISVLEAMAHSLPCVVSKTGGLPESIVNNFNGLVVSNEDENSHVDAIAKLLSDKQLTFQFSINAKKRFDDRFQYDAWKAKMDRLFNEV